MRLFLLWTLMTSFLMSIACKNSENKPAESRTNKAATAEKGAAEDQSEPAPKGSLEISYGPTTSFASAAKELKHARVLEWLEDAVNQIYRLNLNLLIETRECGFVNALYDAKKRTLTICYELVNDFAEDVQRLEENGSTQEALDDYLYANFWFVMFHELGHAFVHNLKLPITGKEEDFADQFAVHMMIDAGMTEKLPHVALRFITKHENGDQTPYWDTHSVDEQRYFNVLCWMYGYNKEKFKYLVTDNNLPEERAKSCALEYRRMNNSILVLTAKHVDPKLLADICKAETKAQGSPPQYCE